MAVTASIKTLQDDRATSLRLIAHSFHFVITTLPRLSHLTAIRTLAGRPSIAVLEIEQNSSVRPRAEPDRKNRPMAVTDIPRGTSAFATYPSDAESGDVFNSPADMSGNITINGATDSAVNVVGDFSGRATDNLSNLEATGTMAGRLFTMALAADQTAHASALPASHG